MLRSCNALIGEFTPHHPKTQPPSLCVDQQWYDFPPVAWDPPRNPGSAACHCQLVTGGNKQGRAHNVGRAERARGTGAQAPGRCRFLVRNVPGRAWNKEGILLSHDSSIPEAGRYPGPPLSTRGRAAEVSDTGVQGGVCFELLPNNTDTKDGCQARWTGCSGLVRLGMEHLPGHMRCRFLGARSREMRNIAWLFLPASTAAFSPLRAVVRFPVSRAARKGVFGREVGGRHFVLFAFHF
ncbi:hypothetical protein F5X68DRAFT_72857 [Plectosphaerella plurivora]|uniref:Uncharacterized protein n=1 Tax=Plectosphaerella plurivora TaxID=936078 RepID=A0A9P8VDF1_9PEZI|nr:hypothetical protein F5X68DRAFT_72857 [Plectosphaerella plurivora]